MAIERNFGGIDTRRAVEHFGLSLRIQDFMQFKQSQSTILIKENMKDRMSRHLMLIV